MRSRNLFVWCLLPLVLTTLAAWAPTSKGYNSAKWVISASSNLRVNGSTNVNKFVCEINGYDQVDTLSVMENSKMVKLWGSLNLDIENFDCHNPVMTRDLQKTLKAKQYPQLCINFLSLNKFPELSRKPEHITGWVDIDLAGVRKRVEVTYKISVDANKNIHLIGEREVKFSDFNLVPPTKFKGMVQTKENLNITFHLQLKPIAS
ncbi:hypothetical protein TH63_02155 [Rufibacter radiotolerans]|uniref:Uncharacterized protein n=1 Tax=Rufibacter radiotolerans TaxID=1379910 RepID=A0A0H4VND3_9BACT|nr:YceI family protein [Rufibacter radiotolerans]AKQ47435.1 hypothetical protein TH63_02155 [Rufibacter radiotolerans]